MPSVAAAAVHLEDSVRRVLAAKSPALYTISPDASIYTAIERMADKGVGALLVLEGESLIGIVTERDYARKVVLQGRTSRDTPVSAIMVSPVLSVAPGTSIGECMRLMTAQRIRHVPVVEDGTILGVVSIGDLVNWVISAQGEEIAHLRNFIAGSYPG